MRIWHYPERSPRLELLDAEDLPVESLHSNLRELAVINRWLGGYRISELALEAIKPYFNFHTFIDIGCGGGDTLQRLLPKIQEEVQVEGWDLKADCLNFAQQHFAHPRIHWQLGDFRAAVRQRPAGVLFHASLFFHHFKDEEILAFLLEITAAGHALVINDLERHRFARNSIALITQLWPGASHLVRHDAPLSVERAFIRRDWELLLAEVPNIHFTINYRWAFRHQICIWPIKNAHEG
jgi:SAM-dependent methyltransferase